MNPNCIENATEAACARAKGLPFAENVLTGTDSPGGVVQGWFVTQLYVRSTPDALYIFLGVPGETAGWFEITIAPV